MLSHCWVFWLASFGNHTSTLMNVWFWRFRLFFMVHISKEMLNVYQLQALINCPDFFVHWAARTKTSIHIFVYRLCPFVVEGALGTERRTLGFGECASGYEHPVCWAEASQWIASCSHHGSRKALDWFLFRALKQFFTITLSISNFLRIIFSTS